MPRWIGNEPSRRPHDPRVAKAAADLASLQSAARTALASLADMRANPSAWLDADARMRVAAVEQLCELADAHAMQLRELLETHATETEP